MNGPQYVVPTGQEAPSPIGIDQILSSSASFLISSPSESGGTTLCLRLRDELSRNRNVKVFLRDAQLLPSYRRKLEKEFAVDRNTGSGTEKILILDNYAPSLHERLLKEICGLGFFSRYLIMANDSSPDAKILFPDNMPFKCELIYLWRISRPEIRILAQTLFESSDDYFISSVVDKVYGDLLALCIPLTPSNVIMYLSIIFRDGEFNPLNRVQIVERYLNKMLQGPGDLYSGSFTTKNKMDVISAFAYFLFKRRVGECRESDWYQFCADYKSNQLVEFDEVKLYNELRSSRIILLSGQRIFFKYRFFFAFFIARYVSARPKVLKDFIDAEQYLCVRGLVEAISGLSSDNTILVTELTNKLEDLTHSFATAYIPNDFDPFLAVRWAPREEQEDALWSEVAKSIESGPHNPAEMDEIKKSLVSEKMTKSQAVAFDKFGNAERRLVAFHLVLEDALKNCDELDGELKKRAARAVLLANFKLFQIATILAPVLFSQQFYNWNGVLFVNSKY
jgi:hypothetical protein